MASGLIPDPANLAAILSDEFLQMSVAIDQIRTTNRNLSDADAQRLGTMEEQLDEVSGQLNAEAIAQILASIRPQLDSITQATQAANEALKKAQDIQKAFNIAAAAVALGGAILTGNLGTIAGAVGGVVSAVRGSGTATGGTITGGTAAAGGTSGS
jgi:hypothetical protein